MIFLIDTDICSAHMRRPTKLAHRFVQYTGQIAISTVTLTELYAGAYKHSKTNRLAAFGFTFRFAIASGARLTGVALATSAQQPKHRRGQAT